MLLSSELRKLPPGKNSKIIRDAIDAMDRMQEALRKITEATTVADAVSLARFGLVLPHVTLREMPQEELDRRTTAVRIVSMINGFASWRNGDEDKARVVDMVIEQLEKLDK